MSISSSSSAVTYPFPLEVNVANFVPIKLIDRKNHSVWKLLMLDLIVSHQLAGFVSGTIKPPENKEVYWSWRRSDGLVRGWIFVTVGEEILLELVGLKTARDVWFALERKYESVPQSMDDREPSNALSTQSIASSHNLLEVNASNFVPIKLGRNNYSEWKQLMLDLIVRHRLVGFIDGTIQPPEKENKEDYLSWKRSDGIVRQWIFLTVIEELLLQLDGLETAREVWLVLEGASESSLPQSMDEPDGITEDESATTDISRYLPLHKAILNGDWETTIRFLHQYPNGVRNAITMFTRETALMLAVRSPKRKEFAMKLMEKMSWEDVERRNDKGETALHVAMMSIDNNAVVEKMVSKHIMLPDIRSKNGTLAVHMAASRGSREMVDFLLRNTHLVNKDGELDVDLLSNLANGGLYDIALSFLRQHPKLTSMEPSPLKEMVHHSPFHSRTRSNFFQRLIYYCIPSKLENPDQRRVGETAIAYLHRRDAATRRPEPTWNCADCVVHRLGFVGKMLLAISWDVVEKLGRD